MKKRPRLLLFPASLRTNSHQLRLIDYFVPVIEGACRLDILSPGTANLPLFDQDLEHEGPVRDQVIALHERFEAADGLVVASPEYNASVSPYLKNTVDWISRLAYLDARFANSRAFLHKPLLLASASTGWSGGTHGLQSARAIFAYLGCLANAEQICVSYADHFATSGQFQFEPGFAGYVERTLKGFVALVERLVNDPAPPEKQASYA